MKRKFRLEIDKYDPLVALRNIERFSVINLLYLDYMLQDGKMASVAVIHDGINVLKDLNKGQLAIADEPNPPSDDLGQYVHIFESKSDWKANSAKPVTPIEWANMCESYYTVVLRNVGSYLGKYEIQDKQIVREPFNMLYVKAQHKDSNQKVHIKAVNAGSMVYDIASINESDAQDYIGLVEYVNRCIGGEPVWKTKS